MIQQPHCWAYTLRKPEGKGKTREQSSPIHTNLSKRDVKTIVRALPKLMRGEVSQLQVPDKNGQYGTIRCIPDYEARKIANFLYDAGYELNSPY